jgi:hypothetical protein
VDAEIMALRRQNYKRGQIASSVSKTAQTVYK